MMKRIVIFAVFCGLIKLILAALPDSAVIASFCRVPAEVAAFYYGGHDSGPCLFLHLVLCVFAI